MWWLTSGVMWDLPAFPQLTPLWCITKLFFTSFLLCWSIITAVAERRHALLHGFSINISVSSYKSSRLIVKVSECVCVYGHTFMCWWAPTWVCMQMQLGDSWMPVLYRELHIRRKDQENNDRFIITESCDQRYSAAAIWGKQSGCKFCWSGPAQI